MVLLRFVPPPSLIKSNHVIILTSRKWNNLEPFFFLAGPISFRMVCPFGGQIQNAYEASLNETMKKVQ
jgi:hypothetical protein